MKLLVGLGNPGPQYETTRHNAGFLAIDRLIDNLGAQGPKHQFDAEVYTAQYQGEKVLLVKPQTFMNLSGKSVAPIFQFHKLKPEDLVVFHDDLDLPFPSLRIKTGGGAGGHKGILSIDQCLGSANQEYHRVRIGIGRPANSERSQVVDFVLEPFKDEELSVLDTLLEDAYKSTLLILEGKVLEAMNRYNRRERE